MKPPAEQQLPSHSEIFHLSSINYGEFRRQGRREFRRRPAVRGARRMAGARDAGAGARTDDDDDPEEGEPRLDDDVSEAGSEEECCCRFVISLNAVRFVARNSASIASCNTMTEAQHP